MVWRNDLFLKAQITQYHLILKPLYLRIKRSDFLCLVFHSRYLDVIPNSRLLKLQWYLVTSCGHNFHYYLFKIFPRFWLVKTTRIIPHNQLLFSKFGKNLRHYESMTSKAQPAADYWTDDVKMTSKVQPDADSWTVDRENLGTSLCYFLWAEKQNSGETPSKTGKCFEWIIKQLLNSTFVARIWRILQISEGVRRITPSLICRTLHILLSLIQELLSIILKQLSLLFSDIWRLHPQFYQKCSFLICHNFVRS